MGVGATPETSWKQYVDTGSCSITDRIHLKTNQQVVSSGFSPDLGGKKFVHTVLPNMLKHLF